MIVLEQVGGLGQSRFRPGIRGDRGVVIDHHDLEGRRPESREIPLNDRPSVDGLAVGGLPASTGKSALDPDGEEAEHDEDQQPADQHPTEVGCRPSAEPCERTGLGLWGLPVIARSGLIGGSRRTRGRFSAGERVWVEIETWGRCHGGLLWSPSIGESSPDTRVGILTIARYPGGYHFWDSDLRAG